MQILRVSSVVAYIKEVLEGDPHLGDVWVSGEATSVSRSAAGHVYFVLKDERAQLRCVMFRGDTPRGGDLLGPGAQVLAFGRVSVYLERGELQFVASVVQPEGIGAREAEFRRLRDKLQAEGLFDEARKRPIPAFPRKIGVATSPAGAVWHDINNVIARRWPLAEVVLAPTPVQGDLAVPGILGALAQLAEEPGIDVILLARGGGAAEELWPFNDERVARAIYASPAPLVSGVGHETDFTLSDYAADRRAPTPSAAAELVTPDRIEVASRVDRRVGAAERALASRVQHARGELSRLEHRVARRAPDLPAERMRIYGMLQQAHLGLAHRLELERARVLGAGQRLAILSPFATLERGYAIVREASGAVVRSVTAVAAGDDVRVRVADGEFGARVAP